MTIEPIFVLEKQHTNIIIKSQEDRIKELETKMTQILNNMSQ